MTTNNRPAPVSVYLPGSNVMDPLVLSVTTETPMAGRVHRDVLEARASLFYSDVDVRAEFRLWGGSTRRSMAAITGRGPALDAKPSGHVAAVGHTQHLGQHAILCVDSVEDGVVYAETVHVR